MDINLNIENKDFQFLKDFLKDKNNPVELDEVAFRLALFKTKENRSHKVKLYNPNCEYKPGDYIYKEYPGKIPVGSKKYIEMDRGVVLKVMGTRTRFSIDEIQLKYEGTSDFKKYTDYLDRQKIELLLPHKQAKPCEKAEYLPEENDPRKQQDPLEKKDFTALKKKLAAAVNKDSDITMVSQKVLLKSHLKEINDEVFGKIRNFLNENKNSETTEFLVENFVKIKNDDPSFDAYCFALNYRMLKDFKIDFQQTQDKGWGKWNLISVIYYMKKDSPISEINPLVSNYRISNKKNLSQKRRKFEDSIFQDAQNRFFLTQREITSGAIKLKPGFFDLGESIEIEINDTRYKKIHLVYYYKDVHLMLGFKDIFEKYRALQGTIISFELSEEGKLQFSIRTTKKGTISNRIEYLPDEKAFKASDEKIASPVFVNKSMFLDASTFNTLYEKIGEFKNIKTLNKLFHKVFLEFGIKERNYEIHILRLYHILDLIYPIDLKLVEDIILGNEEFVPAEKMVGVFYLDSDAVAEIEEEELKRKVSEADENKKKREEVKRKKLERERRIKEEIRLKREERRKKREHEMWEKERLKKEMEEKRIQEIKKKKEEVSHKRILKPERPPIPAEKSKPQRKSFEPKTKVDHTRKPFPPKPVKPTIPTPEFKTQLKEDVSRKKEHPPRWTKEKEKRKDETPVEKPAKTVRKSERIPTDEDLSKEEIKRQIELEKLKEKITHRRESKKESDVDKKVAYQDNGGFSGIFASKLDQIVKKDDSNDKDSKK